MAYQNIGSSPRFFIDNYQYLRAMGLDPRDYFQQYSCNPDYTSYTIETLEGSSHKTSYEVPELYTFTPDIHKNITTTHYHDPSLDFYIPCGNVKGMNFQGNMKWYLGVLNHNIESVKGKLEDGSDGDSLGSKIYRMGWAHDIGASNIYKTQADESHMFNVLNFNDNNIPNALDGSTILYSDFEPLRDNDSIDSEITADDYKFFTFNIQIDPESGEELKAIEIGSITAGVMYTMPHSPELELSMTIENDGYSTTETTGGSSLTNINYTGAPSWNNKGIYRNPFAIGGGHSEPHLNGVKRNGRRVWTLKFNYMSDKNIFSSNYSSTQYYENTDNYDSSDIDSTNQQFEYNMFTDDSFIAQVWNKTCGGALPFIFQPDSENNNPDQFCIAKFDQDSLKVRQEAYQVYSFSIKIREVW